MLLIFVLSLTLLVSNLILITGREDAVDILTIAMASAYSPLGLDDEGDIEILRQHLQDSADGTFRPFPDLRVTVREADIDDLSPREIRLYIFRQVAEPFYLEGAEGFAVLADDPNMQSQLANDLGIAELFSSRSHQRLQIILGVLTGISLVLLILLVYFSTRYGRLVSPGCVFLLVSFPGAIIYTIAYLISPIVVPQLAEESGLTVGLGQIVANVLPFVIQTISLTYAILFVVGAGLVILALVGGLFSRLRQIRKGGEKNRGTSDRRSDVPRFFEIVSRLNRAYSRVGKVHHT